MFNINYHDITYPDMKNGDGLRVVLWSSSCEHFCHNCHNSQTWNPNSGIPFDKTAENELFRELDNDYISGITFSGGDPLHEKNISEVYRLICKFNKRYKNNDFNNCYESNVFDNKNSNKIRLLSPNKTIWLYSGFEWDFIWSHNDETNKKRQEIISKCDVFVDGKYIDSLRDVSLKWRGSSNQRVINVQESLKQDKVVLYCD
jgi:anaerobic ribonucleoside-triphosphate reductase activating protein